MSVVGFSRAGDNAQPSPSIWADCPEARLIKEGTGFFVHEDFLGGVRSATTTAATAIAPAFGFAGDTDTVTANKSGELGGYLDIETDGDDNDGASIFTQPIVQFVKDSGNKVWFEARLELGAVADQGIFVGLVESAGFSQDVIADNAGALIGESLIGFQILADDQDAVDAVFKLDAGTAVEMKSVMNSSALAADTEFKVGLRFDGAETVDVFFDGVKVASTTISTSTFPVGVSMGAIAAIKTGTGAAVSVAIDWIRIAHQTRR